jgi:murein DD-endopeptidase MepM/ murein hydrolase activator NlpD
MKILILTTQPKWASWPEKLAACRGGIGLVKDIGPVEIDVEEFKGNVREAGGKVDRAWFNVLTLYAKRRGYSAMVLHMDELYARQRGIKQTLRGSTINDEAFGEMYVIANQHTKVLYKSGREVDRFVKVFLHEMSHWFAEVFHQEDRTHYWDYEKECIMLSMSDYEAPKNLVQRITSAVRRERVTAPLANWTSLRVTQHFGAVNKQYASGIHAGTDIACPQGTPVYAPTDGAVTFVWAKSKTLGNACLYEWHYNGKLYTLRLAHLQAPPRKGTYRRGEVIALTGNTGTSTGPHLHIEVWKGGYLFDVLKRADTVREHLVNPFTLFGAISN